MGEENDKSGIGELGGGKMSVRAGVRVSPVCHQVWPFPPQPIRATVEHGDKKKKRRMSVGSSAVLCVAAAQKIYGLINVAAEASRKLRGVN